ncbi:MAG: substrate-binding domain-containing protein [Anaerolineae bacterium]|nr:substrate-binding domain-containing protein [Anaerolineae bacterium]
MKRAKRTLVLIGLALASCRGPTVTPTATPQWVDLRMAATTATFSLLDEFARGYAMPGVTPDMLLAVNTVQANWDTVYGWLVAGEVPFALTTYLPPDARLWAAWIGQDGIAIITDAANVVPALALADVRLIFEGRITNWREVGGPDLPVTVISREDGADTHLAFRSLVLGDGQITLAARLVLSGQSMVAAVAGVPGAVGYVSMAQSAGDPGVRAIPLMTQPGDVPHLPTPATVTAGTYPLITPVLVVGPQPPASASAYRAWFAWMQGAAGQQIVEKRYGTVQS